MRTAARLSWVLAALAILVSVLAVSTRGAVSPIAPATSATSPTARVRRVPVLDDAGRVTGLLSMDDVVVRGVPHGDIAAREIVETLHDIYTRRPRAA